ncbi:MAG: hypothetical protein Q8O92_13440 [Candidatus Latescibacter sp.]|nr:hypothetical protein [Candidatus Latescibacter sp.]
MKKQFYTIYIIAAIAAVFPAASQASEENDKIRFHGYGELHYNNSNKPGSTDMMDNHRLVLGWTYRYSDRVLFNAEVDFEHAAKEMELEFAFVDILLTESFNIRAGSMLMPVGYLNEFHEPPLFYSVERPYVQKNIIPTTWQEGGIGVFGKTMGGNLRYRVYLVGGLNASDFTAGSGIRNGRGKVAESPSNDLALVGRLEYAGVKGLRLGASGYTGNSGQGIDGVGDARVDLWEADARYWFKGLELTGLYTRITVGDTGAIFAKTGQAVGKEITGGYAEAAYHLGKHFLPSDMNLVIFGRHERYNTQRSMVPGLTVNPANDVKVSTFGVSFFPISQVALKADVENWETKAGKSWEQLNVGIGYMY